MALGVMMLGIVQFERSESLDPELILGKVGPGGPTVLGSKRERICSKRMQMLEQ